MATSPNIRPTCAGADAPTIRGSCYNHWRNSEASTSVWTNVTTLVDYWTPATQSRDPYERGGYTCDEGSWLPCTPTTNAPPCGRGETDDYSGCTGSGQSPVVYTNQEGYSNCFRPNGTASYASCHKRGFKNAFARKAHHGLAAYTSFDNAEIFDHYDEYIICRWKDPHYGPDTTKYLAVVASGVSTYYAEITGSEESSSTQASAYAAHVESNSGNLIVDAASGLDSVDMHLGGLLFDNLGITCGNVSDMYDAYVSYQTEVGGYGYYLSGTTGDYDAGSWTLTYSFDTGGPEGVVEAATITVSKYSVSVEIIGAYPDSTWGFIIKTETRVYGSTAMTIDGAHFNWTGAGGGEYRYRSYTTVISGNLSQPYTTADVDAALNGLLAYVPLDDDRYQWRTTSPNQGPLICFDEPGPVTLTLQSSSQIVATGVILGGMHPYTGAEWWDATHENQAFCDNGFGGGTWQPTSYGAYIPSPFLKWTNASQAAGLFQGAFALSGNWGSPGADRSQSDIQYCWKGKYAAIVLQDPRPSWNFARPCGEDKYLITAGTERCLETASGQVLTLDPYGTATNITSNDYVYVGGMGEIDGVWTCTKDTDFQITLNDCKISASNMPTMWDAGTGMVAKLRFPLAPAWCGRAEVLSKGTKNPLTASLDKTIYMWDSGSISVWVYDTNGQLSTHNAVKGISSTTLVIPDMTTASNAKYVQVAFSNDWKWDDSAPKGEFVTTYISVNLRGDAEWWSQYNQKVEQDAYLCGTPYYTASAAPSYYSTTVTQRCLPRKNCSPNVFCFSPNGEEFPNGETVSFTGNYDPKYGSQQFWQIVETMNDLFSYTPCPCSVVDFYYACGTNWTEDTDGACVADGGGYSYYAHRDIFEARSTLPSIGNEPAPALPSGVLLVCTSGSCSTPVMGGQTYAPWNFSINQCSCVAGSGRFASIYAENGLSC